MDYKGEYTLKLTANPANIQEIMTKVLDGAIRQWCDAVTPYNVDNIAQYVAEGNDVYLHITATDALVRLNAAMVANGIAKWLVYCVMDERSYDFDADIINTDFIHETDADAIIQFALFGKIIYW